MDNVRVALWLSLLAMLWLAYTAWVTDHPPALPTVNAIPSSGPGAQTSTNPIDELPSVPGAPTTASPAAPIAADTLAAPTDVVHIRTDVLDVLIDLHGGDLVQTDLPEYPVTKGEPD